MMMKTLRSFVHKEIRYHLPTEEPAAVKVDDSRTDVQAITSWLITDCPTRPTSAEYAGKVPDTWMLEFADA